MPLTDIKVADSVHVEYDGHPVETKVAQECVAQLFKLAGEVFFGHREDGAAGTKRDLWL